MALVEPTILSTRYAFWIDEGAEAFGWYRDIENWNFEDHTMQPRPMPILPPPQTASIEEEERVSALFNVTKELWGLLNVLEKDASITPSIRPTAVERKNAERNCPCLPLLVLEIKGLESVVSDIAREGPSQQDVRRQHFVMQCKGVILNLEDSYSANTKAVVLDLFGRVNSLLLQYRDVVDPFNSCIICSEAIRSSEFPTRVTASCQHIVSTCFDCLQNWVAASLSDRGFAQLKCMECSAILNADDIRAIASQETFQR
jgi:hypothetical protein